MDVVILTHEDEDAKRLICQLAKELDQRCMISHQERVLRAHVPILKIRDKTTALRVDICFNTENGMEGVKVVREYMDTYPEVKYIVCVLKYFLRQRGLNETYYGGVGSFLLFWTVVAAIQHHRREHPRYSGFTLGHYFLHYLKFIGLDLDFQKYGLDTVGQGNSFPKDPDYPPHLLAVRCPLDPKRDIGQNSFHFSTVREAFASAYRLLCAQTFRASNVSPLGCLIKADRSLLERT
jgi:non-canonical poly(A) RNA polymerase PAPD5/7